MVDNSPALSASLNQIFAKLNAIPGSQALNMTTVLGMGGILPTTAGAEAYLETVYPSPDLSATTATATEWMNYVRFIYQDFLNSYQQRDIIPFGKKFPALALLAVDAKFELAGQIGPVSNGTIIPSLIRPVTVYASGGTKVYNWLVSAVTAGWNSPYWTINLNATGSGTLLAPQNRVVMLIPGLGDFAASPKLFEFQFKDPSGRPLGVQSRPFGHSVNNLNIWEIDQAFLVQKNKQFAVDVNFDSAGADEPVVLGAQLQTADYATAETT
ncbi:MAG: hypothetical protein ACREB9_01210 [Thermoplasmata archaeon]